MSSLLPGYEYDLFISYRQKDNRGDKWVTEFVRALKTELDATFKEDISIYFDENPHDGLLETHHVDKSLEGKLKCLVFIPIISQTYCDLKSFAWKDEFCAFNTIAKNDSFGRDIRLGSGNVTSRILPVRIHDLDASDKALLEGELGSVLRSVDFIFKTPGVNRPLTSADKKEDNLNKTFYRDQVNKVANAVKEIISSMREPAAVPAVNGNRSSVPRANTKSFWENLKLRGLDRVALVYSVFAIAGIRLVQDLTGRNYLRASFSDYIVGLIALGLPIALWLAWRYEFSPEGIIRTSSPRATSNPFSASQKRPLTGNLALGILLVLLLVQLVIFAPPKRDGKATSIAVLYFDNISNDPEQEPFSDGITEEITAHLSRIPNMRVTSRTSVRPYKGKAKAMNIRQMAEELGVDHILEGSVRKSGNTLRITAQLIEARTDKHLWTEVYDHRQVADVFEIQSEIAKAIAKKFNVVISREATARFEEVPTQNMKAYELYLKARALPSATGFGIGTYYGSTRKAITLLKEAVALDPDFGDAYILMGRFYSELEDAYDSAVLMTKEGIICNPSSADGYIQLAFLTGREKWLRQAYALDTANGLLSIGQVLEDQGEISSGIRCFQEARRRIPNQVEPLIFISIAYSSMNLPDSADKYFNLARNLDPQSREILKVQVSYHKFFRDAEAWKPIAKRYYGDDSIGYYKDLGVAYLYARKWKEAEAAYGRTDYRDMDVGLLLIKTDRPDSGRKVLQRSLAYQLSHGGGDINLARIYAVLGNRKEALVNYQRLLAKVNLLWFLQIDPFTDYIRDDPEFKKMNDEAVSKLKQQVQQIRSEANKPFRLEDLLKSTFGLKPAATDRE